MKKIILLSFFATGIILFMSSFTTTEANSETTLIKSGNIDFKITNDTGSEFKYCVNGGHNYISSGSTKSFSYSDGQDFYYIEGSSCGKQWFEVSSSMAGKEFKLSQMR